MGIYSILNEKEVSSSLPAHMRLKKLWMRSAPPASPQPLGPDWGFVGEWPYSLIEQVA
jgi:hypothetical protein